MSTNTRSFMELAPSWVETVRICTLLLTEGNAEGKKEALKTLEQMGELADRYVRLMKACKARITGEWDEKHLADKGMLTPDEGADIYRFVKEELSTLKD